MSEDFDPRDDNGHYWEYALQLPGQITPRGPGRAAARAAAAFYPGARVVRRWVGPWQSAPAQDQPGGIGDIEDGDDITIIDLTGKDPS